MFIENSSASGCFGPYGLQLPFVLSGSVKTYTISIDD